MQEMQSRDAGIIRMCYGMQNEYTAISVILCEPDCRIQELRSFLVNHRVKMLELLGL